ncbi:hypothetical protein FIBSPDRAFT_871838, partial [Athelia psychrophila]
MQISVDPSTSRLLSSFGWREEALVPVKEEMDLFRALAAERPALYKAKLLSCLQCFSALLLENGRRR